MTPAELVEAAKESRAKLETSPPGWLVLLGVVLVLDKLGRKRR